ncbi:MAG: CHAP domain-containing protein [Mogibacterium sp.]|nr:CHAP domain-containing protein [Mogibacterium sp.]
MISNGYNKGIRWRSSNTSVATVDSTGKISAKKAGTTTISMRLATGRVFSFKLTVVNGGTAKDMLTVMQTWVGFGTAGGKHKAIIDIYNSVQPLPVGYKVKYTDQWCDACVTAAAIRAGVSGKTGRECGVWRHVNIFKEKGIWIEDGTITPKPGDIIVFSWHMSQQPNNAEGCHIGIVESVKDGKITTIEGNYSNTVKRRTIPVGWGYIRGYARIK